MPRCEQRWLELKQEKSGGMAAWRWEVLIDQMALDHLAEIAQRSTQHQCQDGVGVTGLGIDSFYMNEV